MTEPNANPDAAEQIRLGIANACLMMPADSAQRREEIETLHHRMDREKELVAEAKEEADVAGQVKRLNKVHGVAKASIQIMKILGKIDRPGDRAAVLTQVGLLSKDVGYCDKDLVTLAQEAEATAGQARDDQGSVFDQTSEGQRRGGKDAQPKHVEQPAAAGPAPTPGIPLDEAQRQLEAYLAANPPKRGAKPKERKRLEEQVAQAQAAAEAAQQPEEPAEPGEQIDEAGEGEEPGPDDTGPEMPIHAQMREENAKAEAFLRDQRDKRGGKSDEPPAAPKAAADLDDDLPPPAPRRSAEHRGLGPDAYH